MPHISNEPNRPALALIAVADHARNDSHQYLQITSDGAAIWVADPEVATPFPSMREATRIAFRLPARLRAFGLPREPELSRNHLH
jgi:hypothetical protein